MIDYQDEREPLHQTLAGELGMALLSLYRRDEIPHAKYPSWQDWAKIALRRIFKDSYMKGVSRL